MWVFNRRVRTYPLPADVLIYRHDELTAAGRCRNIEVEHVVRMLQGVAQFKHSSDFLVTLDALLEKRVPGRKRHRR